MPVSSDILKHIRNGALFFLAFVLLSFMDAGSSVLGGHVSSHVPFSHIFVINVTYWLSISILAAVGIPTLIYVEDRRFVWWRTGALLALGFLPAYFIFSFSFIVLDRTVFVLLGPPYSLCNDVMRGAHLQTFNVVYFIKYLGSMNFSGLTCAYLAVVGTSYMFRYVRIAREKEIRASQLETSLARATLHTLTMQLQPHFLFNTLNAISCLVHTDPEGADRMIVRLARFLRLTLDHRELHCIPLHRELEFLDLFLEIEQTRFHERLSVYRKIDPNTLNIPVPFLILQPLVENALRHGIAEMPGNRALEIETTLRNGRLILSVSDDGVGLTDGWAEGTGISNTRGRLRQLYGEKAVFAMEERTSGGVRAWVEIPTADHDRASLAESGARL